MDKTLGSIPLVSVLMTAFNRQQYIAEAIESVLSSTYPNWELIIVDDCSTDNTVSIAKEYAGRDERISVFINERNLGDYPNRNFAASLAKGEFIMYCDSDDKIFPHSIQYLVDLTNRFPDRSFFIRSLLEKIEQLDSKTALQKHFFEKQFLFYGPGAMFINKEFFERIGKFPIEYGPANDMYFNLKAVAHSGVVVHPNRVNFYRLHDNQERNNEFRYIIENFRYMNDALHVLNLPFNEKTLKWLKKKNCRRFIVNSIRFAYKSDQPMVFFKLCNNAGFNMKHFIQGVIN